MVWIDWRYFTERWLERAERRQKPIDDGDRFISLWIAFNGWMKGRFGEAEWDKTLIKRLKKSVYATQIFKDLKRDDVHFVKLLQELSQYTVSDMRYTNNQNRTKRYEGTFDSLIDVIYQVRCNLFHGRKNIEENKKDLELVRLSYQILLPLLKGYLSISTH